jgi:hypothetical protein
MTSTAWQVLIPVFNEWDVVSLLLRRFDDVCQAQGWQLDVLLVDDGSYASHRELLRLDGLRHIQRVDVLTLGRNLGSQRAIAVGLCWLADHRPNRATLILDGDGEDDPCDAPALIKTALADARQPIVFAARSRRRESWLFQLFYRLYQALHIVVTGSDVRVGNFSFVPARHVRTLCLTSELWTHYAASVLASRTPRVLVPTPRAKRLAGQSKMNFYGLVEHGLGALSIHAPKIAVRGLMVISVLAILLAVSTCFSLVLYFSTGNLLAGLFAWNTLTGIVVAIASGIACLAWALASISLRQTMAFIPLRDYKWFVLEAESILGSPLSKDTASEPMSGKRFDAPQSQVATRGDRK